MRESEMGEDIGMKTSQKMRKQGGEEQRGECNEAPTF